MKYIRNEDAVSPVIGVILMVVITVIIAAILAVFAFGIGAPNKAPEAKLRFTADAGGNNFMIYHDGGDTLVGKDTRITIRDGITEAPIRFSTTYNITDENLATFSGSGTLMAGSVYTNGSMTNITSGDMLRVLVMDVPTGQMISDTKITAR